MMLGSPKVLAGTEPTAGDGHPALALAIVGLVALSILATSSLQLSRNFDSQTTPSGLWPAVAFLSDGPMEKLSLSYTNPGAGAGKILPLYVGGVLNLSGTILPLTYGLSPGRTSIGSSGLGVGAPPLPERSECEATLTLSSIQYGKMATVNGTAVFGPSVVSVSFGGISTWPALGLGIILPRPHGQQTASGSTLLTIVGSGSGNSTGRLLYYVYNTAQNESLQATSQPFPISTNRPTTLTVDFFGNGSFASFVNGQSELLGSIPLYSPAPQQVGIWTNSTASVDGVYVEANGQPGFAAPSVDCGSLTILTFQAAISPQFEGAHPGSRLFGPFANPESGSEPLFVLEAFTPSSGNGDTIWLASADLLVLPPGDTLSLELHP
ncbi:MAG: hypothetical protein KGJ23_11710 [Euryarchaeota archaeon]|nr:hypothetical protein [Euryarchaeota archaeon]MDE1837261.1 hypothetical protein [Euryarchaeota archaeon]MDE1879931.1 hypothetical protein [Euryarchaeota archaeon]MDE2045135.1 hypothetical protein [Thermoplasmata archaeon]